MPVSGHHVAKQLIWKLDEDVQHQGYDRREVLLLEPLTSGHEVAHGISTRLLKKQKG